MDSGEDIDYEEEFSHLAPVSELLERHKDIRL